MEDTSILKSPFEDHLVNLMSPWLSSMHLRIVDLDYNKAQGLKIFIEKTPVSSAVTIDDCQMVSQRIHSLCLSLDQNPLCEALIQATKNGLEVSSPGLSRRLRLLSDFNNHIGKKIQLLLHTPMPIKNVPSKKITGKLISTQQKEITCDCLGALVSIPLSSIKQANLYG